jgi:hypothetical protein
MRKRVAGIAVVLVLVAVAAGAFEFAGRAEYEQPIGEWDFGYVNSLIGGRWNMIGGQAELMGGFRLKMVYESGKDPEWGDWIGSFKMDWKTFYIEADWKSLRAGIRW